MADMKALAEAVISGKKDDTEALVKAALDENMDPGTILNEGLIAGMSVVGEKFKNNEFYIPKVLMAAKAMKGGVQILQPLLVGEHAKKKGTIVMGTVKGDLHDIGKNLVKIMFDAAGWTVYDLGKDVKLEKFVDEQQRTKADIVALSALMTTSMMAMPKVIQMIKAQASNVAVMVGGAPITQEIAMSYGADGYADTAANAVEEAAKLVKVLREGER